MLEKIKMKKARNERFKLERKMIAIMDKDQLKSKNTMLICDVFIFLCCLSLCLQ